MATRQQQLSHVIAWSLSSFNDKYTFTCNYSQHNYVYEDYYIPKVTSETRPIRTNNDVIKDNA